jgi:uncharacterized membrane protein YbhN (UPF0104 family)
LKKHWFNSWWFKAACTIVLIGLILAWIGPKEIWNSLLSSDPGLLGLSLLLTPIIITIKTLRWLLLARTESPLTFRGALSSYLAGLTLATLTPLAAGEAGRGFFVRTGDRAGLTGKVLLDKLVDLSTVGIFACIGLLLTKESAAREASVLLLIAIVVAWAVLLLLPARLKKLPLDTSGGWLVRLRIPDVISGLINTPRPTLALNAVLALIGFAVFYGQAFVLLRAFYPEAPLSAIPYFPIITLSTILPIAIGGLGIREWTAVLLLKQFGIPEAAAFNAFFVHFVVVQLLPSIAGAFIIGFYRQEREPLQEENSLESA